MTAFSAGSFLAAPPGPITARAGAGAGLLDRMIARLGAAVGRARSRPAERGLFQSVQPRSRALFVLGMLCVLSIKGGLAAQGAAAGVLGLLALGSGVPPGRFLGRVLPPALVFGILIPLPAWSHPGEAEAVFFLRVFNSLSALSLWLLTTPFHRVLEGLKVLGVPESILMVADLARRFFALLGGILLQMHLGLKSRRVSPVRNGEGRRWLAERLAFALERTRRVFEDLWRAMRARSPGRPRVVRPAGSAGWGLPDTALALVVLVLASA